MKHRLAVAWIIACAHTHPVLADTRLDMFERVSERSTDLMLSRMVDMAVREGADRAQFDEVLVPFEWNDDLRAAGQCLLDRYDAILGTAGTDALMDALGALTQRAETDVLSLEEIAVAGQNLMPDALSDEVSMTINAECGMTSAQIDWMQDTGFTDAMMGAAFGN